MVWEILRSYILRTFQVWLAVGFLFAGLQLPPAQQKRTDKQGQRPALTGVISPAEPAQPHRGEVQEAQETAADEAQVAGGGDEGTRGRVFQLRGWRAAGFLQEAGLPQGLPRRLPQPDQETRRSVPRAAALSSEHGAGSRCPRRCSPHRTRFIAS